MTMLAALVGTCATINYEASINGVRNIRAQARNERYVVEVAFDAGRRMTFAVGLKISTRYLPGAREESTEKPEIRINIAIHYSWQYREGRAKKLQADGRYWLWLGEVVPITILMMARARCQLSGLQPYPYPPRRH